VNQYQVIFGAEVWVTVDANNEDEAIEIAEDIWIKEDVELLDAIDVDLVIEDDEGG
jgi:uncharacterized protein (UPF0212 family)